MVRPGRGSEGGGDWDYTSRFRLAMLFNRKSLLYSRGRSYRIHFPTGPHNCPSPCPLIPRNDDNSEATSPKFQHNPLKPPLYVFHTFVISLFANKPTSNYLVSY